MFAATRVDLTGFYLIYMYSVFIVYLFFKFYLFSKPGSEVQEEDETVSARTE